LVHRIKEQHKFYIYIYIYIYIYNCKYEKSNINLCTKLKYNIWFEIIKDINFFFVYISKFLNF